MDTEYTLEAIREAGAQAYAFPCDVGDEESVKNFFYTVSEVVPYIHHVVHTAGISPNEYFLEHTASLWNEVLRVNTTGTFLVAKYALDLLPKGEGSMVFITSTNGINSYAPYSAAYDSSKAAANIFVKNLSEFVRDQHIRVNAVAPGWVDTSLNDTLPP